MHVKNDPSSHLVQVQMLVRSFYKHANFRAVTKPSRTVPELTYEDKIKFFLVAAYVIMLKICYLFHCSYSTCQLQFNSHAFSLSYIVPLIRFICRGIWGNPILHHAGKM